MHVGLNTFYLSERTNNYILVCHDGGNSEEKIHDVEQIDFKNENASMVVGSNHWVFN